ncbi:acyl-CoA carboxylase subunit epsilon [Kitasatospora sp. NPDC059571]|uniref:acyl-CoA carboxylase subunit epsilon n=1 Tax=Kitasatospora sp. NPDC059571 TaxID=3346871 RepID=UPI00369AF3CB
MNDTRPEIRFTAGNPTPEEIAVVTAVLHTLAARPAESALTPRRITWTGALDYQNPNSWRRAA